MKAADHLYEQHNQFILRTSYGTVDSKSSFPFSLRYYDTSLALLLVES